MAVDIPRRGLMLVLSSPSGAGKTTLSRRLLEREDNLEMSVSVTTRPPRSGEVDGRDYVFVDQARFAEMVLAHSFLEHAVVFGHHYGTPKAQVEAALAAGRDVLFDVDWQGTQQLVQNASNDIVSICMPGPRIATRSSPAVWRAPPTNSAIGPNTTTPSSTTTPIAASTAFTRSSGASG